MIYIKRSLFVFIVLLSLKGVLAQNVRQFALKNVNIIDVNTKEILADYTILIDGKRIKEIVPSGSYNDDKNIPSFSLKGKYVVPGLIDAHVHLATNPSTELRSNAELTLKNMLYSGITAVRDMAGDARALSSLSRDALVGDIDAPNIYYSSLMAGEQFFTDPRTIATAQGGVSGEMPYMKAITKDINLPLVVAQAKGTGAQGIKLYADLTPDQILSISKEARNQEFLVWSHAALIPTKPSEIIKAKVLSISHSSMLVYERFTSKKELPEDWFNVDFSKDNTKFWEDQYQLLDLQSIYEQMIAENVVLDATMSLKAIYDNNKTKLYWRFEIGRRINRDAHKAGVKIAAGSDSDQTTFVQHEMKLLIEHCGFTPIEALVAATKHSAQATGILETQGSVEEGKFANLLILDDDPSQKIEHIDSVYWVIKEGRIFNRAQN